VASQDFDKNGVRDGFDVLTDHTTFVVVDSRYTIPANGGSFTLTVDEESHNNNDCRNIGSYKAAPVIDGNIRWKQRWRGQMISSEYVNFFGATGPSMGYTDAVDANNPHQAFFKVEIPANSGKYLAYTDWWGALNLGEAGHKIHGDDATHAASAAGSFFHPVLSLLNPDPSDSGTCTNVAGGIKSSVYANANVPYIVLDSNSSGWGDKWLAVSNRNKNEYGTYELSIIKAQNDFFGFFSGYSEEGSGRNCGTLDYFDAEGVRLDFIPDGHTENGYLMTITNIGDGPDDCPLKSGGTDNMWDWGWLVHPECYGPNGNGHAVDYVKWKNLPAHSKWRRLPFMFPFGNEFYNGIYLDTSGRIEPRKTYGSCNNDADCNAYSQCSTAASGCVCVAEFGNQCAYNPGSIDVEPDAKKFFMPHSKGGYAPVIAAAWGSFQPVWANGKKKGFVTAQTVVFEGTLAYVISFVGLDIDTSAPKTTMLPNYSSWRKYYAHPSYQVILRSDGRIVYYYRPDVTKPAWDETVDRGTFFIGLAGGTSTITCSDNSQCTALYGTEAQCDNTGPYGYSPTNSCFRRISPLVDGSDGIGNE
jgi:hypothetical protein